LTPNTPDNSIDKKLLNLANDPNLIKRLTQSLAPQISGLETIKQAILYHLVGGTQKEENGITSRGALHVLIIGDPGTGKTQLMQSAEKLGDSVLVSGTGVNSDGFSAMVTIDQNGRPVIIEGALVKADQKYLHIDKLDKMSPDLYSVLETSMEQQCYPLAKNGVIKYLDTRVSVLATSNPVLGRYNMYQTIGQNINLPIGLLNCFDLIFISRDHPDHYVDQMVAERILQLDHSKKPKETTLIEPALLRQYIELASQIKTTMTHEAKTRLKDYYLEMRKATEQEDAISITPRQLQSLIRLSEAHAKLHLRESVLLSDVTDAYKVFSTFLEQVAVDVITGHIDIDVLVTGKSKSLRIQLQKVLQVVDEMERISGAVKETDLYDVLSTDYGVNRGETARLISNLLNDGLIYMPRPQYYRRTD
jgi:replicative DNA helicase Mcm